MGVAHTDHVAPGNVAKGLPDVFVCFQEYSGYPRKLMLLDGGSYDLLLWKHGEWVFVDNVSEDTARDWYKGSPEIYVQ